MADNKFFAASLERRKEMFTEQLNEYGCGYYKACWEHACPCNVSINLCDEYDEELHVKICKDKSWQALL